MVDSILRGVEIGIGPRRTRQTNKDKDKEQSANTVRHFNFVILTKNILSKMTKCENGGYYKGVGGL